MRVALTRTLSFFTNVKCVNVFVPVVAIDLANRSTCEP